MNKQKTLAALLAFVLTVGTMAGCGSGGASSSSQPSSVPGETSSVSSVPEESTPEATVPVDMPEDGLLMGLAVDTSMRESKDATADQAGSAKIESTFAAVLVDRDGKIVSCTVNGIETSGEFDAEGKVLTDLTTRPVTKNELGAEYGMAAASPIGKEWNEQVMALSQYVVGKTADEVAGIAITEDGKAADAELSGSMTMYLPPYLELIAKAANSATYQGSVQGNQLGLGCVTHMEKSADAGDRNGQIQAYSYYVAATVDNEGKVTGAIVDSTQGTVTFDATGKITSDLRATVATKNELGEEYGMAKASAIGLEWNVQAANFAQYVQGKTVDEINGIAVNEETRPTDSELSAGVSIAIGDIRETLVKAVESAS